MKQNTRRKKDQPSNGSVKEEKPYTMLGAGNLTAALWKYGDKRSGWHYRFNVFRMGNRDGRVSQRFLPRDVADLAKLAQVLAFALTDDGCLDQELRDDLSCLSACLDQVLPEPCENVSRHPHLCDAVVTLLRSVLDLNFHSDERHFGANPIADHVYRKLLLIDRWLEGVISPENAVLPELDLAGSRDTFGGCPLCGMHDGCVNLGDYHWYVCRTHQFRWCVGHGLFVPEVYEDTDTYMENWQEIRDYRVVEPFRRASEISTTTS